MKDSIQQKEARPRTAPSKARSTSERILARTLSGALYAIVTFACIFLGALPLAICVACMAWLCASEFFRIARLLGRDPNEFLGLFATVVFVFTPLLPDIATPILLSAFLLLCGLNYVVAPRKNISDIAITIAGALYTGYLLRSLVEIRLMHASWAPYNSIYAALLVFGVFSSIWMSDALAYFIGSRFGKHKMFPHISPKKSWEGFVAGLIGSIFVWWLMYAVQIPGMQLSISIVGGFLVGISGLVGDLFESRLKRSAGIKDSGNFMPGHGGMLDRSDSILFGAMVASFILQIAGFVIGGIG